jgi:hypothetical protein
MAALRVLAGLALAGSGLAYLAIGVLFILGSDAGEVPGVVAFGILGICAPVFLCGVHLAFFGGAPSFRARLVMLAALVLALLVSTLAVLPQLFADPPQPEAPNAILGSVVMTALFGWPIALGVLRARRG